MTVAAICYALLVASAATLILGWEPKVSLSDGLRRTVEDFRERMKV